MELRFLVHFSLVCVVFWYIVFTYGLSFWSSIHSSTNSSIHLCIRWVINCIVSVSAIGVCYLSVDCLSICCWSWPVFCYLFRFCLSVVCLMHLCLTMCLCLLSFCWYPVYLLLAWVSCLYVCLLLHVNLSFIIFMMMMSVRMSPNIRFSICLSIYWSVYMSVFWSVCILFVWGICLHSCLI